MSSKNQLHHSTDREPDGQPITQRESFIEALPGVQERVDAFACGRVGCTVTEPLWRAIDDSGRERVLCSEDVLEFLDPREPVQIEINWEWGGS